MNFLIRSVSALRNTKEEERVLLCCTRTPNFSQNPDISVCTSKKKKKKAEKQDHKVIKSI